MRNALAAVLLLESCSSAPEEPLQPRAVDLTQVTMSGPWIRIDGYELPGTRSPHEFRRTLAAPGVGEEWLVTLDVETRDGTRPMNLNLRIRTAGEWTVWEGTLFQDRADASPRDEHVLVEGLDTDSPALVVRDYARKTERRFPWDRAARRFR